MAELLEDVIFYEISVGTTKYYYTKRDALVDSKEDVAIDIPSHIIHRHDDPYCYLAGLSLCGLEMWSCDKKLAILFTKETAEAYRRHLRYFLPEPKITIDSCIEQPRSVST